MTNEELKREIREIFKSELEKFGSDFDLIQTDKLPNDPELKREKTPLHYLGKFRGYFVWLYKAAEKVAVIITLLQLPQTIDNLKLYFPQSYDAAVGAFAKVKDGTIYSETQETPIKEHVGEGLEILNPIWLENKVLYEEEKEKFISGSIFSNLNTSTMVVPTSGSNYFTHTNSLSYSLTISGIKKT